MDKARSSLQLGNILVIGGCLENSDQSMYVQGWRASLIRRLTCNHEEADTRMLLHTSHAVDMLSRAVIVSPDTDVGMHFAQTIGSELWFKTGVKGLVWYIQLHDIAGELGSKMCDSILAPHAPTGCDSTSYLSGKATTCVADI